MKTVKLLCVASLIFSMTSFAAIEVYEFDSPQQEAQYRALIADFRCPTCQNQNLAGSDAPIAQDLKQKTYEMVKDGRSDKEIRDFMFERYGDFISYKPPVRPSTWILWFFPPILLIVVIGFWLIKTSRKKAKTLPVLSNEALSSDEAKQLEHLLATHQKLAPSAHTTSDDGSSQTKESS